MKSFPILQKARLIKERKPPRNADLMRRSRTVEGYGVLSQQIGYRKFNRLLESRLSSVGCSGRRLFAMLFCEQA
jgi:hypothetical protein